ncbi:helix-turn-helix domain-containing protein [Micromonospora echinofusca]|uniref:helix-turn-helix domain-containing protein n=1 Tax=Micromonospora echinofusca TaxID=47858 RepID=UPI00343E9914
MAGTTRLQRAAEDLRALELRRKGLTLEAIAEEMGLSRRTVERRLRSALERMGSETADQIRRRSEDQIDAVLRAAHELLELPNLSVPERVRVLGLVLQCDRQRTELLGAKMPSYLVATLELEESGLEVGSGAARAAKR